METNRKQSFMNSSYLVDWRARENFKALGLVDLRGGFPFNIMCVRSGHDGREYGIEVI